MKVQLLESKLFVYGDEIVAKGSALGDMIFDIDSNARNSAQIGCGVDTQLEILFNELKHSKNQKAIFVITDLFRFNFNFFKMQDQYIAPFCRTHDSLKTLSRETWVENAKHVPFITDFFKKVVDVPSEFEQKKLLYILSTLIALSHNFKKLLIINRGHKLVLENFLIPSNIDIIETNAASEIANNNYDKNLKKIIKKWIKLDN